MKSLLLATALLVSVSTVSAQDGLPVEDEIPVKNVALTPADVTQTTAADLQADLRELWNGHVFWARSAVLAAHYDDTSAKDAASAKADENTRALANSIAPFYGQEQADVLYDLLSEHGAAVMDYMEEEFGDGAPAVEAMPDEAMPEEAVAQDSAMAKLIANAEEIADFLEMANPDLPKTTVLPMLETHVGHHADQIEAIAAEDFEREAETWTAMVDHVYQIADAMASAISTQFPDKVTG